MELGAFSISLAVKDIHASVAFYEKLGFVMYHDSTEQKWAILKNRDHIVGLFEGMFEKNMLTFNPGWDQNAQASDPFTDVRDIERELEAAGLSLIQKTDGSDSGPASIMLEDPDGNPILIDQHR